MLQFSGLKIFLICAVCVLGVLFAAPNLIPEAERDNLPGWLPHRGVTLGLDLQGGSHILLEVGVEAMVHERLETLVHDVRRTLRGQQIGYTGLRVQNDAVRVRVREPEKQEQALAVLRKLSHPISGPLGGSESDLDISTSKDGLITVALSRQAMEQRQQGAVAQSLEIVRRRIDQLGMREPAIQREGAKRILVQLPGVNDPQRIKDLLGKTAKLTFQLVDSGVSLEAARQGHLPPGDEVLPGQQQGEAYVLQKRAIITGENLVDAQPSFDSRTGEPVVNFRFDSVGSKRFGDVTRANVGRLFAIVLDNKVISAPVIREPITGGSGQISGQFTVQSANDLAVLLRAGALPAPLTVLEERTVGPGLGADSIRAGVVSIIVAVILVVVYMMLTYGLFGLFADVALVFNLIITLAVMSMLQATLTLPGIAGLLLSLGMSVDANVLINERIREETHNGRSPLAAIETGFKRAFSTIIDANMTTLIKMLILYMLGSGAVKGFAVTISIGILCSMFTALLLVRLMIATWLRRRRPKHLPVAA